MQNEKYISNYIVGFVDVMGQRSIFNKSVQIYTGDQGEAINLMKDTYSRVENLKTWINSSLDRFYLKDSFVEGVGYKVPKVGFSRFSDCLEVHIPMIEITGEELPIASLYATLTALASACLFSLASGYAVRGGLSIGLAIENEEKAIYGPALYNSVILEEKIAKYPRIVLDKTVVEYIEQLISNGDDSFKSKIEKETAKKCYELIKLDDNIHFVHYLSKSFIEPLGDKIDFVLVKINEFVEGQLIEHKDNSRILEKYEWLKYYDNKNDKILNFQ